MGDINNPRVLWLKFGLFVFVGITATAIALFFFPYLKLGCLMAIAIWAFCRAYYFAFYVIEHYIEPGYRFAGLGSFIRYALRNRNDTPIEVCAENESPGHSRARGNLDGLGRGSGFPPTRE
jgi:hypothetical protein